jgi:hypothetical protein
MPSGELKPSITTCQEFADGSGSSITVAGVEVGVGNVIVSVEVTESVGVRVGRGVREAAAVGVGTRMNRPGVGVLVGMGVWGP